jgi:8-oxo-dGTP pyrophosphatase MutT (NUDIX family)
MDNLWRGAISIKGVLLQQDRVLLIKTRRGTWDLPGGKLEIGETPVQCLERECREELGITIEPCDPISYCMHPHFADVFVVIVGCRYSNQRLTLSPEHIEAKMQPVAELDGLGRELPGVYADAILKWTKQSDPKF